MALSNAELTLLLRAKDESTAVLKSISGQLDRVADHMEGVRRSGARLDQVRGHLRGLEQGLNGVLGTGAKLGAVAVGIQAVASAVNSARNEVGDIVRAASDSSESMNKVDVVFGSAAASIREFANTADTSLGLSRRAALEAAGTFGNLFTAMGFGGGAAADMSKNLLSLAADLASFNNITVDEALIKLRAGLVGETEPLRTLGVNLNAAEIEIKAVEMGLIRQGQELTAAGKAAAAYALIFEQTKTAQGDFARTSDGLANQLKILDAGFNDLKSSAGEALLPLATDSVQAINAFIAQVKRAQGEGFNVLDAGLKATAATIKTNFGADAARSFEIVTDAIGRMADAAGKGDTKGFFQGIGDIGEQIGRDVKEKWLPAFLEWAEPAKDATGAALNDLWQSQLKPWVESTGEQLGTTATKEWIPAFTAWADENKGVLRPGLQAIGEDAVAWSKTEGAGLMRDVAKELAIALKEATTSIGPAIGEQIGKDIVNETRRRIQDLRQDSGQTINNPLPPGGAQNDPNAPGVIAPGNEMIMSGGVLISKADADANLAAARAAQAEYNRTLARLREEQQRTEAEASEPDATTTASPARTGGAAPPRNGREDPIFGRDDINARARKAREEAKTAIQGFMAELARDAPRWERMFGELGGRAALALIDAIESDTESGGAGIARAIQDLKKEAERAGVPEFGRLGDELAGSVHDALIDRGNPALRAAALENLRAYTETIRQANALTPDSFARALDLEGQKAALGTGGRQVMDALSTALKEGGSAAIAALASSVAGMRTALFDDRELTPEHAREVWTRIFGAVNAAIDDGTAEGKRSLEEFFRDLNFEQLSFKVGDQLEKKIVDLWKDWEQAVTRANDQAAQQIEQARNSLQEGRDLRGARDNVDRVQAEELKNVVDQVNIAREAWRDYRDKQHLDAQRTREDADLERRQMQEMADLAKRLKERRGVTGSLGGGAPVGSVLNPNQGIGQIATDPQRQMREELKALQERHAAEKAERDRRRGEQDDDLAQQRRERKEDKEEEEKNLKILDGFRREQAENLRTFLDAQENEAHERNLGRIQKEAQEAIAEATRRRDEVDAKAWEVHNNEMERINLQREGWGTVLDGYLADLEEVIRLQKEGPSGPIKTGPDISTEPLPVGPGPGPKTQPAEPIKGPGDVEGGPVLNIANTFNVNAPIWAPGGARAFADLIARQIAQQLDMEALIPGGV